jgi:hypothetical protein
MPYVDMRNLPSWKKRSCLPNTDTQIEALAGSLDIGYQYGARILTRRESPMLSVVQGKYAHQFSRDQLQDLSADRIVRPFPVKVPTPAIPSLSVQAGEYRMEAYMVVLHEQISQIHLLVCHGSVGSFPSPGNENRFQGGCGIVSTLKSSCSS